MKNFLSTTLLTTIMATGLPAVASTIPFTFSTPAGTLGVSQSYTSGGITITARGYSGLNAPGSVGTPVALYGKTGGGDENGLGIADGADREIIGNYFIQLDFRDVKTKLINPTAQMEIGSVQSGESYSIYGSNSVGMPGTVLISNGTLDDQFFPVPNLNQYSFYSIGAPSHNVLLDAVSVTGPAAVPEPGTFVLFAGVGLISVAFSRRLRKALCGAAGQGS
ncbi:MAG: PEP-CTERM sorting domain-containing protein [Bryobacteraceae bacterium]